MVSFKDRSSKVHWRRLISQCKWLDWKRGSYRFCLRTICKLTATLHSVNEPNCFRMPWRHHFTYFDSNDRRWPYQYCLALWCPCYHVIWNAVIRQHTQSIAPNGHKQYDDGKDNAIEQLWGWVPDRPWELSWHAHIETNQPVLDNE